MPTYAFRCPQGHDFDRFYKTISGAAMELPCPECGEMGTRQMSGGAGLMFKGSGFYLTDYGKNAHRGESKPAAGGDSAGAKSGAAKAEGSAPKAETAKPKADAPAPKAESPKPKSSKPKSE